jgi:hypothetical protein
MDVLMDATLDCGRPQKRPHKRPQLRFLDFVVPVAQTRAVKGGGAEASDLSTPSLEGPGTLTGHHGVGRRPGSA